MSERNACKEPDRFGRRFAIGHKRDNQEEAGAQIKHQAVAKLSQNAIGLTCFGICFERKQIP
jgi:hypothetical protein